MYSFDPGIYRGKGQPDIIVTYGGEIHDDPEHYGPLVQWCFPWEEEAGEFTTTIIFEFEALVKAVSYKLCEARPSRGFRQR